MKKIDSLAPPPTPKIKTLNNLQFISKRLSQNKNIINNLKIFVKEFFFLLLYDFVFLKMYVSSTLQK